MDWCFQHAERRRRFKGSVAHTLSTAIRATRTATIMVTRGASKTAAGRRC